jgi:hypothetical protein
MSIIEKRDVKNHLSLRHSRDIHLCEPLSQPDATGYSVIEADAARANPSGFADDYSAEHTIAATPATPGADFADPTKPQAPETSKSARR